jgi:hypothetical protein
MLIRLEYLPVRAEIVRLQLEGVIADSCYPVIKNGEIQYYEYENALLETSTNQDIVI